MPFKIVQTIERGEACLTVVPSKWEEDGVLHWPKKNAVAKLSLDEFSVPSPKWERIDCVRKREYKTRHEADEEMARMESVSDTETDEVIRPPPPKKKRPQTTYRIDTVKDFNEIFGIPGQDEGSNDNIDEGEIIQTNDPSGETITVYTTDPTPPARAASALVISQDEILNDQQALLTALQQNKVVNQDIIVENQQVIVHNQLKIMHAVAKLQTGIDFLLEMHMGSVSRSVDPNKPILDPVDSLEELNALEENLKDTKTFEKYVSNMGFICGTGGKEDGMDSSYKLIDYFATREFMHKCSWTGNTKINNENIPMNAQSEQLEQPKQPEQPKQQKQPEITAKIPLKFYALFRSLFFNVIRLADKDFTEVKCDEFFKRVMKNSKARLQAKALSTHKNRPANLTYKPRAAKPTGNGNEVVAEHSVVSGVVEEPHQSTQEN